MKTKNLFRLGFLMIAVTIFILASCSKEKSTTTPNTGTESLQQLSSDENNIANASTQACNDAESVLSQGKLKSTESGPCNTTITIGGVVDDTISVDIYYHGPDCSNKVIRSGHVIVKKKYSEDWGTAGATVILTMNQFTLTKIATGKSLTLNGSKHFRM